MHLRFAWLIPAALLLGLGPGQSASGQTVLAEWVFADPKSAEQWLPNQHLADLTLTKTALACRATGADPFFSLGTALGFKTSPAQWIELRLKADRDGVAQLFWTGTTNGPYGGLSEEKSTRFNLKGDQVWHVYRFLPLWEKEGRIIRLRLDLYDAARFELGWLRILDFKPPEQEQTGAWNFSSSACPWLVPFGEEEQVSVVREGRVTRSGTGFLLTPTTQFNSADHPILSVTMSADSGRHGTIFFVNELGSGMETRTFRLQPDGGTHTYNLDMRSYSGWKGRVRLCGLQPSDDRRARARVLWLKAENQPLGPPRLMVNSFALEEALPRVGRPTVLAAVLSNAGGETARKVKVRLGLPKGLRLEGNPRQEVLLDRLGVGEEQRITWQLQATVPQAGKIQLRVSADNARRVNAETDAHFTHPPKIAATGYVPEPKPVRGSHEVGVYYFPGWKPPAKWAPIQGFPERKPVLGWYDEGRPDVADWHIKWAVEHGITFFVYDWYWSQGQRQLEHGLHDGYFHARYRHLLKFCLLWANHNPPNSSSREDCLAVTRHWITNYFHRPEYLRLEGKPVMVIFSPDRLTHDLGNAGVRRAFEAMRDECRRAGLPGLHLVACVREAAEARLAAEEGYDTVNAYTWPHLGMTGAGNFAPFATLLEGYRRHWQHLADETPLPIWPLPVSGGWDSRPWHGENNLVRFDRTPALFEQHLRDAKEFLDRQAPTSPAPKAILIEAWNEWGEGSYIEPHAEFGFGYLDAIRNTFSGAPNAHEDLAPRDVGLGPYEAP